MKIPKAIVKILIVGASLFVLVTLIVPIFHNIFNIGNVFGIILCVGIIAVTVFWSKIIELCKHLSKSKRGRILVTAVASVLAVGVICFSLALGSIIYEAPGHSDNQQTIIVLGCAVKGDTPSFTLKSRVRAAYDYLTENESSVAVLSGGQGPKENISEAQCMYNLLTEMGIDKSRLYIEDKSVNTETNIKYSMELIEKENLSQDIAIVSSDYHLKRAKMICKKQGLEVGTISSGSTFFDKSIFYLREVLGVVKEFIVR